MDAKPSGNVSFPTYKDKNWTSIRILLLSKGGKCRPVVRAWAINFGFCFATAGKRTNELLLIDDILPGQINDLTTN